MTTPPLPDEGRVNQIFDLYRVADYAPQLEQLRGMVVMLPHLSKQIKGVTEDARQASTDSIICQAIGNILARGRDLYVEPEIDFISTIISDELIAMDNMLARRQSPPGGRSGGNGHQR